jgi:hypothetical protein
MSCFYTEDMTILDAGSYADRNTQGRLLKFTEGL